MATKLKSAPESVIYAITHVASGRKYVGSAVHWPRRLSQHRSALRRGKHANRHLQSAWNKYGESAFCFDVIERVPDAVHLIPREQAWIDQEVPHYNKCPRAGSQLGFRHSEETKRKNSEMSKGRRHTEEAKRLIGEASRKWVRTPEMRAAIAAKLLGHPVSEKARAVSSARRKGVSLSSETRSRISAGMEGRVVSEETRAKQSATMKARGHKPPCNLGRKATPEARAAMKAAALARAARPEGLAHLRRAGQRSGRKKQAKSSVLSTPATYPAQGETSS